MKDDLISRYAAIDDIRTMIPKDARLDIKWIEMWLMQLPSAQPEIVRCKDCKECWYSGTATIRKKVCEIYKCKFWDDRIVSQNGYCYMAERRTDDSV